MGSGVPLLNEYKQEFFWKRVPQSVLGGPKLKLGYDAPAYVYINQVLLFLVPWVVGGIFTALVQYDLLKYDIGIYIVGGIMCAFVLLVNFVSEMRKSKVADGPTAMENKAKNMLSEDDEIDFQSCCGVETVKFILPGKKYKINILIHALLAGPLCGLGFWFLLPLTLEELYGNIAATILLYVTGWLTLCIAQYSFTVGAPPETANFRALDTWEVTPLMRPFYCLAFFCFHIIAREYELSTVNQVLHIVFVFLPLLWLLGTLPPLLALLPWLGEQGLVVLFGGSPMASDLRLFLMVVVSVGVYLAAYFIPHGLVTVALLSLFGYVLSLDLAGLGSQLLSVCFPSTFPPGIENTGFLWKWGIKETIYHVLVLGLTLAVALVVNKFVASEDPLLAIDLSDYLAYAVIAFLVIEVILAEVQSVYVLFGLWRNKLYPSSVQRTTIFRKGKSRLAVVGIVRRVVMDWVSPFLMVAYLSASVAFSSSVEYDALDILGLVRAYRWVWQSTQNSMLEIGVAHVVSLALPDDNAWHTYSLGKRLLLVGFARDRLAQFLNKFYFYVVLLIWSWKDKKQRRKNTYLVILFNVLLFPVTVAVMLAAAALAAPLLPLFTLPVFFIGFPRPNRFWPAPVGASANVCEDTVYYTHMAPQLSKAFRDGFASGSLGEPSPGSQYLVRSQDRMAWIMVLERGYGFCTVSIKGLELQETSCHTIEAGRIEDTFEVTFEKENGVPCCSFHPYPTDTLRPYDAANIQTYSDAKNVLTGVIDSPETLQKVADDFMKCLVWVMLHHNLDKSSEKTEEVQVEKVDAGGRPSTAKSDKLDGHERPPSVKAWKRLSTQGSTPSVEEPAKHPGELKDEWESHIHFDKTKDEPQPKTVKVDAADNAAPNKRPQSAKSLSDSIWSDDSLIFDPVGPNRKQKSSGFSGGVQQKETPGSMAPVDDDMPGFLSGDENQAANTEKKYKAAEPDDSSLFGDTSFGLPAADIHQKPPARLPPLFHDPFGKAAARDDGGGFTEGTTVEPATQYSSRHSRALAPPDAWRQIPVEPHRLEKYAQQFPLDWYKHVLGVLKFEAAGDSPLSPTEEVTKDRVLEDVYTKLVAACDAVVNSLGLDGVDVQQAGAAHVHRVYCGDVPWSLASAWVTDNEDLRTVVVKAYRYSVKLAIEQMLMGEVSGLEELQEYMEEFDRDWFIGSERDAQWRRSVAAGKPTLFSLGHNTVDNTYSSRTLTKQDVAVYIGSVNAEAVRGQWANLALELLYMTNDDEERYSIQAHPTLLRNLTVQTADPPLGYPIYSSPPTSIPTI